MKEKRVASANGLIVLVGGLAVIIALFVSLINVGPTATTSTRIALIVPLVLTVIAQFGLYRIEPNQAAVLSLFGKYIGTTSEQGLRWNNPFFTKRKVSLRVRNFESGKLKVNELDGSPIEIAAVVVWKVVDSSEAVFNVDDYESFVQIQSESAVRAMASSYPYDQHDDDDQPSLRGHPQIVSKHLMNQIQERLSEAGVEVVEARISHLAYAPEIAHAMLQRQQASAIIAARTRIVEGAVSMVEMALAELRDKGVIDLDEERRAAMVSNLLVVLCSDRATQPIVNTGTIYQ